MRTIYITTNPRSGEEIAFSQRRAAERYRDAVIKTRWEEATNVEAIGARWAQIVSSVRDERVRQTYMDRRSREMEAIRRRIDAGFRQFARDYRYNYSDLPTIREVVLFRTFAESRV